MDHQIISQLPTPELVRTDQYGAGQGGGITSPASRCFDEKNTLRGDGSAKLSTRSRESWQLREYNKGGKKHLHDKEETGYEYAAYHGSPHHHQIHVPWPICSSRVATPAHEDDLVRHHEPTIARSCGNEKGKREKKKRTNCSCTFRIC